MTVTPSTSFREFLGHPTMIVRIRRLLLLLRPIVGSWSAIAWLIVVVLVLMVAAIGWAVVTDRTQTLDAGIAEWFAGQRTASAAEYVGQFTVLGGEIVLIFVTLTVGYVLLAAHQFRAFTFWMVNMLAAKMLIDGLKELIDRERPTPVITIFDAQVHGFPSGHAMMSMVVYVTLALQLRTLIPTRFARNWLVISAVLLSLALGISRLYLDVHYFSDVLAGWLAGLAWVTATWRLQAAYDNFARLRERTGAE